jgi:hypothetical protein
MAGALSLFGTLTLPAWAGPVFVGAVVVGVTVGVVRYVAQKVGPFTGPERHPAPPGTLPRTTPVPETRPWWEGAPLAPENLPQGNPDKGNSKQPWGKPQKEPSPKQQPLPYEVPVPPPCPKEKTTPEPGTAKIWRAISTAPNLKGFNWNPTRRDEDGLSGTQGGNPPYWTDPAMWFQTVFRRSPDPSTDRIVAASRSALVIAGFSVEDTPKPFDPWHVSIGGQTPGITTRKNRPSWPGTKPERSKISTDLESVFTEQVWP